MNPIKSTATVEVNGQIHVVGLPFAPGTEVDVTISPKVSSGAHSAHPGNETEEPAAHLGWRGNVLVHHGVSPGVSVAELRDERLDRLSEGSPR